MAELRRGGMYEPGSHAFDPRHLQDRHLPPPHPDFQPLNLTVHTRRPSSPPPPTHSHRGRQEMHSPGNRSPDNRRIGSTVANKVIYFESKHFRAGQIMRAELIEIQKADLGRKYARVDRRPLDPPPVILLRLFEVFDFGTDRQTEKEVSNYEEIDMLGLVGTVDLFQVSGPSQDSGSNSPSDRESSTSPSTSNPPPASASPSHTLQRSTNRHSSDDIIHYVNDQPITESSRCTNYLVGSTFIQPHLVEYQGKKVLVFVFADLAVKVEGVFVLRYRAFDLFSSSKDGADEADKVMQAECFGGPFKVYSTKDFPGLQASTDLTKHLARWGVRLNIREMERRRRKKGSPVENSLYTTEVLNVKRKRAPRVQEETDSDT